MLNGKDISENHICLNVAGIAEPGFALLIVCENLVLSAAELRHFLDEFRAQNGSSAAFLAHTS